ncbi:MAG: hypothetical protein JO131_02130 [Gammaproteobacteria bacterium]|nr:hypothetical protein [Gammaproteobacteria bacterium]
MAGNSLSDCILKQNLFLQIYSFSIEIKLFLIAISSYPLRAVMECGRKIAVSIQRKRKCILRLRVA